MKYAHIVGWGSYLPDQVMTNDDIAKLVETSDDWIYTRTGIRTRRIAGGKETTATLAFEAAARALRVADIPAHQIDLIIVATSTPEYIFPSTACRVQDYLGANRAGAFDLSAACTGFVYGVDMATQAIASESIQTALVIGSETLSRVLDWKDRGTCILFGDGAGAVVLRGSSVPGGVMASTLRSDGSGGDMLTLPAVYHNPTPSLGMEYLHPSGRGNTIDMNGRQVFRFARSVLADAVKDVLEKGDVPMSDLNLIVPHQANMRIIKSAADKLGVSPEIFHMNVDQVGNTSAASIPIALCDAIEKGRMRLDDNVVFVGFGGGLTWGATLVKWNARPHETPLVDREWKRMHYFSVRGRSRLRRLGRKLAARLGGSFFPEASLKDAQKRKKDS